MTLYIATDLSPYELPLFVGTRREVATWANMTPENISGYCQRGKVSLKNKCKFEKVKIDKCDS